MCSLCFVRDLRQVGGFFPRPPVSSTNKTDRHDVTEILLKVALNTIKQTNKNFFLPTCLKAKLKTIFTCPNPVLHVPGFGQVG
jgi:hypothetical protein